MSVELVDMPARSVEEMIVLVPGDTAGDALATAEHLYSPMMHDPDVLVFCKVLGPDPGGPPPR